jgi:FkbM family methyltransferase
MAQDDISAPSPREEELQAKLNKLRRRQKRNERAAWAGGFLTAVVGMLRPGDLAIDLGANVGDVSARLLSGGADVIAFDPEPWAVEKLQERFADEPRFTLHNAAVGTKSGSIRLHRAANFNNNEKNASVKSTIVIGGRMIDDEGGVDVEMIDFISFLQGLIAERGEIAFLKMDIEGAELELLDAMHEAGVFASIRCTVAETHENKYKELRPRYRALREKFAAHYAPTHVNLDWI